MCVSVSVSLSVCLCGWGCAWLCFGCEMSAPGVFDSAMGNAEEMPSATMCMHQRNGNCIKHKPCTKVYAGHFQQSRRFCGQL